MAGPLLIVSDVADYLNIDLSKGATTTARLQSALDDAIAMIERRIGPLTVQSFTDRIRGGSSLIVSRTPLVDVTTITIVGGPDLDLSVYTWDTDTGIICYPQRYIDQRWIDPLAVPFPASWYDVTYEAGRNEVASDMLRGVKEMVRHLYQPYKGGPVRSNGATQNEPPRELRANASIKFPQRVLDLIEPEQQIAIG